MSARSRCAGLALGVVVTLAAGILIGRGLNGTGPDGGALTAGPATTVPQSTAEARGPDPAKDGRYRRPPPGRGGSDRLEGEWGKDDNTQADPDQWIRPPTKPTKGPSSGGRPRPPRVREDGLGDGASKPEPERRGGSDAVDA
ncbi:MAG: hypothetical protein JSU68_00320 [Phycisphaerales bacterium]|nr:MAG: hypothetical protein JSU68_00320 [Phycisphaerales bacterium]